MYSLFDFLFISIFDLFGFIGSRLLLHFVTRLHGQQSFILYSVYSSPINSTLRIFDVERDELCLSLNSSEAT